MPTFGISSLVSKLNWLASARRTQVTWLGGVVSFTFDDFPKSAFVTGGKILEQYGARGTYYTTLKFAGAKSAMGRMFDFEDVRAAHRAGHEIACHTFTHLDCAQATKSSIRAELSASAAGLSALIEGFVPKNFAYPYGSISPPAKRVVGARYSSCRGISPGMNQGTVDLDELLANRIYARDFDEAGIFRLIDRNSSVGGWLIFYTHDVADTPGAHGCTPEQLKTVVAYAARHTTIQTVRDVVRAHQA